jgi:hypothetical protein
MCPQPNSSNSHPPTHPPTRTVRAVDAGRGEVLCGCVPATAAFVPVSSSPSPDRWDVALPPGPPTKGD